MDYYTLLRPLLFSFPAETAHNLARRALRMGVVPGQRTVLDNRLAQDVFGLSFPNPVGLAAGFDKNAEMVSSLLAQGFGFIEVGTVTPEPQAGNQRPRLFRLSEDQAIINRLGFNNDGLDAFAKRLESRPKEGIVGANVGRNKHSENNADDYVTGIRRVYGICDYITVNISSPNTPDLRELQHKDELHALLTVVMSTRNELRHDTGKAVPILVKIAPDIDEHERKDIAHAALSHQIDGLIIGNTTIGKRESLKHRRHASQQGGLSGKPLFALSTQVLADMYRLTEGKIPLIGVGGVFSGEDAYRKIRAGASLIQLYTALIYEGFGLIRRINDDLAKLLEKDGFTQLSEAVGADLKK